MKYLLFACVVVLCLGNVSLTFFNPTVIQAKVTAAQTIATAKATAAQTVATAIQTQIAARQAFFANLFGK